MYFASAQKYRIRGMRGFNLADMDPLPFDETDAYIKMTPIPLIAGDSCSPPDLHSSRGMILKQYANTSNNLYKSYT